jgi:Flp pilus assembly protein CpaB
VLSAGQSIAIDGKSQPIATPVVTLLVSPEDAEALTLSNIEGRIQLVLRNSTDRAMVATGGRRLHDIYGTQPEIPRADTAPKVRKLAPPVVVAAVAPPVAAPAPEQNKIIVINGAIQKVEVFAREPATK